MNIKQKENSGSRNMIDLLKNAVRAGVQKETSRFGVIGVYINKKDAYLRYGRATVDRWIKERLVRAYKTEPKKEFLNWQICWRLLRKVTA